MTLAQRMPRPSAARTHWQPLGPHPFGAVLVPTALSVATFAARAAASDPSASWTASGLACSMLLATVTLVTLFAVAERRPELMPWLIAATLALGIAELHFRSVSSTAVVPLVGMAVLAHVAWRRTPSAGMVDPSGAGVQLLAGIAAIGTGLALVLLVSPQPGGVIAGFALAVVGLARRWPAAAVAVERNLAGLAGMICVVGLVGVAAGLATFDGTRSLAFGALIGATVLSHLAGARWLPLAGTIAAAAIVMAIPPELWRHSVPMHTAAGFAVGVLAGHAMSGEASPAQRSLLRLSAVFLVGVLPTALAGQNTLGIAGAAALGALCGVVAGTWHHRAAPAGAVAAVGAWVLVLVRIGPVAAVALAVMLGLSLAATGLAAAALHQYPVVPPGLTERLRQRAPLIAWIVAAGAAVQIGTSWRTGSASDPASLLVTITAIASVTAVVLISPAPGPLLRWARLAPLHDGLRTVTFAVRRGSGALVASGDLKTALALDWTRRSVDPVLAARRPPEPPDPLTRGRWDRAREYGGVILVWLGCSVVVKVLAASASMAGGRWPTQLAPGSRLLYPLDFTGRIGWGTGDYLVVAERGYTMSDNREAFLPVLPLSLRWLHRWSDTPLLVLQVGIATVSGLACVLLFWSWMRKRDVPLRVRWLALVLFLVLPWNFLLFGYGYADPTLVALVLGAFLLVERDHPVAAGVVGAVAAATRPNGVALIPALLLFELVRSGALRHAPNGEGWALPGIPQNRISIDLRRMRPSQWGVLISVTLIGAFSVWMWHHAGSPLYWLTLNEFYGHPPVTHLVAWSEALFAPWTSDEISGPHEAVHQVITAAVTLGSLLMLPAVRRRFGAAYGAFAAMIWVIAWTGSRLFTPGGRLIMPITPFLAVVAATWLVRRPGLSWVVVVASTVGSLTLVVLFTRGGELWLGW